MYQLSSHSRNRTHIEEHIIIYLAHEHRVQSYTEHNEKDQSLLIMNTTKALSKPTSLLARSLIQRSQPQMSSTLKTQFRQVHNTSIQQAKLSPLAKPIVWTMSATIVGGLAYGLTRSIGRIGGRFEAREKRLNRQKWLGEGGEGSVAWL